MTDHDDPLGPAWQSPTEEITTLVQKVIKKENKEFDSSSNVEPTGGAVMGAPSVDAPSRVNQQPIATAQ